MVAIPVGSEFQVNTFTTEGQDDPEIAVDANGNFIIVWESYGQDGDESGIYAQRYNADGTPDGSEFQVNTFTNDDQLDARVTFDGDGDFVITWGSYGQDGDGDGIFAQRYNADGTLDGSEFQVNTFTTDDQEDPQVAVDEDGNFVIVWESYGQDGDGDSIYAQRYNADGTPDGSEFQVNTFTTGDQDDPSVAMDADGNFIISWESSGQDGDEDGIYAQQYNADGSPDGSEFQVNTFTTGDQDDHQVAVDPNGNFIITWESSGQDGDGDGIYAQRFNAHGTPVGGEFQVNTFTIGNQDDPQVAVDPNGNFVIVWESSGDQDGDGTGIFAQYYNADGTPDGGEFQVNTFTTDDQDDPAVAVDGNGNFVITWESYDQDGDGNGVYVQQFITEGVDITGTPDDDFLTGTPADDLLDGLKGDDTLVGGGGNDTLVGGSGDDTVYGGPGDDTLRGNGGNDLMTGADGNDTLRGSGGMDTLNGSAGDDWLDGGGNDDLLRGGSGDDLLEGKGGRDRLLGGAGNDSLRGGNGNDILVGGLGDDTLRGSSGNDFLRGGFGDDELTGGSSQDTFILAVGEGTDTITDFDSHDVIGLADGLMFADLTFVGNDILSGGEILATISGVDTTTLSAADFVDI